MIKEKCKNLKCLRGRVICEIIPTSHTRPSGILILDRKEISAKGRVIAVGKESMNIKLKPILPCCVPNDIIHFKKYVPKYHDPGEKGMKEGLATLFWEDITAVEKTRGLKAVYDSVIIICTSKAMTSTLIIPEHLDTMEHTFKGEVVSVGPDFPDELSVGDIIVYPREEGIKVIIGDITYLKLKKEWCLAIESSKISARNV